VGSKLEDGTLAIGTSRDDANVGRVIDGNDYASCENDFLPVDSLLVRTEEQPNIGSEYFD